MSDVVGERVAFVGGYDRANLTAFEGHTIGVCVLNPPAS
jgi:hypothetical protein